MRKKYVPQITVLPTISVLCAASLWFLGVTPVFAAQASRAKVAQNSSQPVVNAGMGLTDEVVGVSVTNTHLGSVSGTTDSGEVFVFGTIIDTQEFGSATSFSGKVPLNPGEYVQSGVDSATLTKTFSVDGNEIHLHLTWNGIGDASADQSLNDADTETTRTRAKVSTANRSATVSGSFAVNGLNRIVDMPAATGSLSSSKSKAVEITKESSNQ